MDKVFPFSCSYTEIKKWARENGWTGTSIELYKHDYDGYTGYYCSEEFRFLDKNGNIQVTCTQDGPGAGLLY